ncbi:hypothetical protein AZE42_13807 [Rhizopogon vesiculosus]|uniref:Cytochrome P450 n=1 Tax=Rhizopogon vesiculosus TaxID=180088 RepID=A0A1J8QNS7_9AGAM|nr:hypothetical protein AZE42_13807 [Rhizopogon vesiculosus]
MFFAILAIGIVLVVALRQTRKRVYPLPLPPGPRSWVTYFNWTPHDLGSHMLHGERHMEI